MSQLISVIIVAHDREEYIEEALESVMTQEMDDNPLEIILVKNFPDNGSQQINKNVKIKSIVIPGQSTVTEKLAIGIENSEGQLLLFLEDDDLFLPGHIREVIKAFHTNENLCLFHNSNDFLVRRKIKHNFQLGSSLKFDLLFDKNVDNDVLDSYLSMNISYNMSSISIEKRILVNCTHTLRKIVSSPDMFVFLCALSSGRKILATKSVLTRVRVHDTMSRAIGSYDQFYKKSVEMRKVFFKDFNFMTRTIVDKKFRTLCERESLERYILLALSDRNYGRTSVIPLLGDYLKFLTKKVRIKSNYLFVIVGLLITPNLLRQLYYIRNVKLLL